uniref:BTB/POZ domain-containing protein 17 n=1 Tax=Ascaris suum TaxID=6253 RepID=F1L317_ASCSU
MVRKTNNHSPRTVVNPLPTDPTDPPGMDCFADDREALNDFAKYFNNAHLSDVTLLVGDEIFFRYSAHRIILTKSSEVFDRMLSQKWNGDKKELELVEEPQCQRVFAAFLRFLYCNHIVLHPDNTLPILVLADKYNVHSLRKVCIDYAVNNILPELSLRELFHVWYSYATKAFHQPLINACIKVLAWHFEEMITSEEWEKEWLSVDRDQLTELLKSNDLVLSSEYRLWEAVQKWLMAPSHPERRGNTASPLLVSILPLIRFPFMTADELTMVERSPFVETHPKLFHPQILLAYKFQALPLSSRLNCKEFTGTQFILRNYTDVRWDRRIVVRGEDLRLEEGYNRAIDQSFSIQTRSSTFPLQSWNWKVQLSSQMVANSHEELRLYLVSEDIDQPRSIEYLVSVVDEKKVLRSLAGRKNFTKTRYCADLEIEKKVDLNELYVENSPLLVNGDLHLQITFRPID